MREPTQSLLIPVSPEAAEMAEGWRKRKTNPLHGAELASTKDHSRAVLLSASLCRIPLPSARKYRSDVNLILQWKKPVTGRFNHALLFQSCPALLQDHRESRCEPCWTLLSFSPCDVQHLIHMLLLFLR